MKVVRSWLREFCPTELSAEELAEILTSKGAEVEEILRPWDRLSGVVVAKVIEVREHPDLDKLCLARVTTGSAEREVVVGVRNMAPGDLVPLAGPGTTVPALDEPLSARKIRGVVSDGMLCSHRELAIADVHAEILVLPPDTPLGADFKEHFALDEAVLDIEVTPNRPDFMSVIGIAREVAAATGTPLSVPEPAVVEGDEKAEDVATVEILDFERCPRYLARVIRGVTVGPSPIGAQARLTASGMRPISNVVDATNYALIEIGHPLHPFDLPLLDGETIVVRRAEEGEKLTTLDGVERAMSADDLLIADRAKGVAIAGIMGSASAEVSDSTADVLLESAFFERSGILRTARRLDLVTEASMRFERGADAEAVPRGAGRAAQLIAEWAGGTVLADAADVGEAPLRRHVSVRPDRAALLLGFEVTKKDVNDTFDRLGIATVDAGDSVEVEVPGCRVDLEREIDLIEEIARIEGYEKLRSTLPPVRQSGGYPEEYAFSRRIRDVLVRCGLREVRLPSFASQADLQMFGDANAIRVANPLHAEEGFLRTRLTPGLVRALSRNAARHVRGAALFEIGVVFREGDPVEERRKVGIAMTGPASLHWADDGRELDFFDAKGVVEALLAGLGIREWSLGDGPGEPFHPGRSANVLIGGDHAGLVGEIHPRVLERFDLDGRVAVAVLGVAPLMAGASGELALGEVPRFPPARRDLAFIVPEAAAAEAVQTAIEKAAGELLGGVLLFDVFVGAPVPVGSKSLAFSVDFRAHDRTLTDEEADRAVARIAERLAADFGAELRAG